MKYWVSWLKFTRSRSMFSFSAQIDSNAALLQGIVAIVCLYSISSILYWKQCSSSSLLLLICVSEKSYKGQLSRGKAGISELRCATRSLMIKQHMRGKRICIYISLKQELLSKDKVITLSNQPFKLKYIRTLFTCFGLFQWHRRTKLKLWTIKHLTATAVILQPLLSTILKRYTIFRDINQPSKGEQR